VTPQKRTTPPLPPRRGPPSPAAALLASLPPRMTDNSGDGVLPPTPKEMYELAGSFKTVMLEEIEALDRMDYKALGALSERKRIAAGLFKDKQRILMKHPESLRKFPEAERLVLADALQDLGDVAKRNEIAVRGVRDGHQRFLNVFIRSATKLEQLGSGYAANGKSTALTANYGARQPVSLFKDTRC
jgi:hypothetical protein